MIGLLNLLFVLALVVLAVLFALVNQKEVTVQLPGGWFFTEIPLFVLAFIPLFLGFLAGTVSTWNNRLNHRKQLDMLRNQKQKLEKELTNLRNQPLENDLQI